MPPKPSATSNEPKKQEPQDKPAPYSSKPDQYISKVWEEPLKVVMDTEGNVTVELAQLTSLKVRGSISISAGPSISSSPSSPAIKTDPAWLRLKTSLAATIDQFKTQSHIGANMHTVDEFLVPEGENNNEDDEDQIVIDVNNDKLMEIACKNLARPVDAPEEEGGLEGEEANGG